MTSDRITVRLEPADYLRLLDLLDERIRSERARVSAYRARKDLPNEMGALAIRRALLDLREAMVAEARTEADHA
jgi:hypothetical protein